MKTIIISVLVGAILAVGFFMLITKMDENNKEQEKSEKESSFLLYSDERIAPDMNK